MIAENGTAKYGLPPMQKEKVREDDITVYCKSALKQFVPFNYPFPKVSDNLNRYKTFVPYAWGNMSEKTGLGGAFSDIIIGSPSDACTESYQESGCFDSLEQVILHAKYLMTQFCRALLYVNKTSQHSTTAWGAVPCQTYTEDFWDGSIAEIDEALMEKYKVPQNIRDFVRKNIQVRTEKNIINYNGDFS